MPFKLSAKAHKLLISKKSLKVAVVIKTKRRGVSRVDRYTITLKAPVRRAVPPRR